MVDFSKLLSSEQRRALEARRVEMNRIYGLTDRWLARELLKRTRELRSILDIVLPYDGHGYNGFIFCDVIPELARRLGENLLLHESYSPELRGMQGEKFREHVGIALTNTSTIDLLQRTKNEKDREKIGFMLNESANGSPIAIALDRIVPPTKQMKDPLARTIREISQRRGHPAVSAWHPGLQKDVKAVRRA